MTRIVVADDSFIVREGIREILATHADVAVVALCGDGDELLAAVATEQPDVVVTDIRMPPTNTDEGIGSPTSCAYRIPISGSSC